MEAQIEGALPSSSIDKWPTVDVLALSPPAVARIVTALATARKPLIITSHLGRNTDAVAPLVALSTLLAIPVYCSCPSAVNIPFSHPSFVGVSYLPPGGHTPLLATADVVLVLECDVPWIPSDQLLAPSPDARIFIVNSGDPLKAREMGLWHIPAEMICRADAELALIQLSEAVRQGASVGENALVTQRRQDLEKRHVEYVAALDARESVLAPGHLSTANLVGALRKVLDVEGIKAILLNESITNFPLVWEHMRPDVSGSMITSGGSSLGWALGAAVGVSLAKTAHDIIVAVVGDGSYMFGVPSSAYWMARRYGTVCLFLAFLVPQLMIVPPAISYNRPE